MLAIIRHEENDTKAIIKPKGGMIIITTVNTRLIKSQPTMILVKTVDVIK
jgi:hypothetical protein